MSRGNKPCYPSPALDQNGQPHGVDPTEWPNASEGCPDPGNFKSGSNPFPTYFTVTSCNPDELRVAYHLYFKKDGFSNVFLAKGHKHDWERVGLTLEKTFKGFWLNYGHRLSSSGAATLAPKPGPVSTFSSRTTLGIWTTPGTRSKTPLTKAMQMSKTGGIRTTQKSTWAGRSMQCSLKGIQASMIAFLKGVGESTGVMIGIICRKRRL